MKALVYDIEIIKAIPDKKAPAIKGIEYCEGWRDHAGMGISCIGAYEWPHGRYRMFLKDNFDAFAEAAAAVDLIVTFNGISFDNKTVDEVLKINISSRPQYDILVELWAGAGLGPGFQYPSHVGFGLDAACKANFGTRKTGTGASAPIEWQRGEYGKVIDYCLNDVKLTVDLFNQINSRRELLDPRGGDKYLKLRSPE